jgi:zeaxanthin glucosyltransferase
VLPCCPHGSLDGARIGIVLRPGEPGHQSCAVTLSKRLAARGAQVTFLGLADDRAATVAAGFPFLTLAESAAPLGSIAREKARAERATGLVSARVQDYRWLALQKKIILAFPASIDAIVAARLDLIVCDVGNPIAALVAVGLGLPCVLFETTVPRDNTLAPPMWTPWAPRPDGSLPLRARLAWLAAELRYVQDLVAPLFGMGQRQLAARFAGRGSPIRSFADLRRELPRIVACPVELEFPRARAPGCVYIDALVDLDRAQAPFAWEGVPPDRDVVYVSMGTQTWLIRRRGRLLATFLEAASLLPDVHFVLAAGDAHEALGAGGAVPGNVTLLGHAPQLAVLSRAKVMVTHAGLNSVKECISMGVPMVALPVDRDQPGNAARVAFHRLGVVLDYRTLDAAALRAAIEQVRLDPAYRLATERMKEAFSACREQNEVVDVLARYLPARVGSIEGRSVS